MKKIIYICDRCKKEINQNYYLIDIYQNPDKTGRYTTKGASINMNKNISKMLAIEPIYCEKCIDEIFKVINRKR